VIGWQYKTRVVTVSIAQVLGRWCVIYDDENLGAYHSATAAADDVAGGHTFSPSNGVDLGRLGIPRDIREWTQVRFR